MLIITGLPQPAIDSHMLSLARVTLCELLAWRRQVTHSTNSQAHQLAVLLMRSSPRVCTLVLFIILAKIISQEDISVLCTSLTALTHL